MQTLEQTPTTEPTPRDIFLRALFAISAVAAGFIYIGALLSPVYFSPEVLTGQPMAVFMGIGNKPHESLLPYQHLSSLIGALAGILAASFGLYLLTKAWQVQSGKQLAKALIVASLGFALLHYFSFIVGRMPSSLLYLPLNTAGVLLIVAGSILWARWAGIYPRAMTRSEIHLQKFRRYRFGRRKHGIFKFVRWLRLEMLRQQKREKRLYRKIGIDFNITQGSYLFLQRVKTNRWLLSASVLAVLITVLPFVLTDDWAKMASALRDGAIFMFLIFMIGIANEFLQMSYAISDEVARRKIIWLWLGSTLVFALITFLLIGCVLFLFIGYDSISVFMMNGMILAPTTLGLVLVISIMISVLSQGAIDPRLAISRTTIYGIIAVLMTSLFVAIEAVLSTQTILHFGFPSQSGAVATGVAATLIFSPIRNRIEAWVNNWIRRILPPSNLVDGDKRRSAVAFNDLSGYTKLSETDERLALMIAAIFHREAFAVAAHYGGRVVKTIGDAAMLEFTSVSSLVTALQNLHNNFADACQRMRIDALPIHSGVHVGEVFRAHDGDIYGQTVNLASRLENVAGKDEIVLSEAAWQELQDRDRFLAMGERSLKNVAEPVNCYRFVTIQ